MTRSDSKGWEWVVVGGLLPVATAMADPAPVAAVDAEGAAGDRIAEVVVTGSNVRGAELEAVTPIQIVDRAALEEAGASQFSEMLKDIPANTGTALYNESGQLSGTAQFELRGLGFSSTLVLVNGRRAGVAPLSDKSGSDFLDINQFPLAMVDRVEVLKDGASAIYGSEAVAGVVNIITRRGFEGLELSGSFRDSSNEAYSVNLAAGSKFSRGLFNLYATYYGQTRNQRSDFDWLIDRVGGSGIPGRSQLLTANGYPGTYSRGTLNAAGNPVGAAGATGVPDPNCEQAGGVFRINDNGTVNRAICNANFTDQISVVPAQRRLQAFAELGFEVTDRLSFYNETNVSGNLNLLNEQPGSFSNGSVVSSTKGYIYVPAEHPFNFFTADPANPNRIVYVDPAQWNPAVHQAVPVVGNFRPEGPNITDEKRQQNDYFRTVNGFDFDVSGEWTATLSDSYAYAKFEENDPLGVNAQALANALLSGDYNPFATSVVTPTLVSPKDGASVADNSAEVLDQFFYTATTVRKTEQHVAELSVSGPALRLPTGDISLAVGGQYRSLSLKAVPDSLAASGGGTTPSTTSSVYGKQEVKAAYLEAVVPFEKRAQVQLALRREDYGGAAGSSVDPKLAGRIEIVDGLGLRGSWGTSFQAPTLTQQSEFVARVQVNDPVILGPSGLQCAPGGTVGSTNVTVTTNGDNLTPQSSENFNLGVDFSPLDDLSMTVDYWHYRYSNLIAAAQNAPSIVAGECVNGVYVPDPRVQRGASGQLSDVANEYVNVGKVETDGFDLSAVFRQPLGSFGLLRFRTDATYINKFDVQGPNGTLSHNAGSRNFNNNFAPMPRVRAGATLAWDRNSQNLTLSAHFTDGYRNDQSNNAPISSFTTVDAQYGFSFGGADGRASTISVGVDNLLDKDPPALVRYTTSGELVTGLSAIDRPAYDPLAGADIRGRMVYARFVQRF